MNCPGLMSPVNPTKPLALCVGCGLHEFAADGIKPAAKRVGGTSWRCDNRTTQVSSALERGISAGAGTDTSPAIFSSGD